MSKTITRFVVIPGCIKDNEVPHYFDVPWLEREKTLRAATKLARERDKDHMELVATDEDYKPFNVFCVTIKKVSRTRN